MAYETKVILNSLARSIAKLETAKEAYNEIVSAANVEGMNLPTFEGMRKKIAEENERDE